MLVSGIPFYATVNPGFLILSVVGFVVMFAGVVFAITGNQSVHEAAPKGSGGPQRRVKGGSGTFASRMEDRFRRRFEP